MYISQEIQEVYQNYQYHEDNKFIYMNTKALHASFHLQLCSDILCLNFVHGSTPAGSAECKDANMEKALL